MENPVRFATILPLDYTPDRTEHSIIFVSKQWSELETLLTDPVVFFETQQPGWPQKPGKQCAWCLKAPVTVIVEWGAQPNPSSTRLHHLLEPLMDQGFLEPSSNEAIEAMIKHAGIENHEHAKSLMRRFSGEGGFTAEFAADTHTLLIYYFPPLGQEATEPRFKGEFTAATLGKTSEKHGDLHYDIGSCATGRAQFVMDYIQNIDSVIARIEKNEFLSGTANLVPEGTLINQPTPLPQIPVLARDPATTFPRFVIEGASSEQADVLCCVCTGTSVVIDGETILLGDMILKCYVCPPPPPPPPPSV